MLSYEEIIPEKGFQFYIRKFWILDNSVESSARIAGYALPNGCFTLAFITGSGIILEYDDKRVIVDSGSHIVGQVTSRVKLTVLPYTKAFMTQLNPWTASLLSSLSYHELVNQFAPLGDLNKSFDNSMAVAVDADNHVFEKIVYKNLQDYLYPSASSTLIASCFDQITNRTTSDLFKMADLSTHTNYSSRSLEKKFKQCVGLSPKKVDTISRVRSIVEELTLPPEPEISLTALAYNYGFFDQSHFIRTYSSIMDTVPSKFNKDDYILPFQS